MNQMKKILFFFILIFIGCKTDETTKNELTSIKIDFNKSILLPDKEWVKAIKYIPLQTNGSFLIGNVQLVKFFDQMLFLIETIGYDRQISIFKADGSFVNRIYNPGEGPGKFLRIDDIWYNSDDQTIELLDFVQSKIVVYNLKGDYLKDTRLPNNYQNMAKFDDNNYVFYAGNSPQDSGMYNINYVKDGKVQAAYLPFPAFFLDFNVSMGTRFSPPTPGGFYLVHEFLNDTIYLLERNPATFRAAYKLDLGDKWINNDWLEKFKHGNGEDRMNLTNKSGKTYNIMHIAFWDDKLFCVFPNFTERRGYFNVFDTQSNRQVTFYSRAKKSLFNNFDLGPIPTDFKTFDQNKMIFFLEAFDLKEHCTRMAQNLPDVDDATLERFFQLKAISDKLDPNANPVMMIIDQDLSALGEN